MARQAGINGFVLDIAWNGERYDAGAEPIATASGENFTLAFRWRNEAETMWSGDGWSGEERSAERIPRLMALVSGLEAAVAHGGRSAKLLLIVNNPIVEDAAGLVTALRSLAAKAGLPPLHLVANRAEDKGRFISAGFDALIDPGPDEWHSCPPTNNPTGLDYLEVMAGLKDSAEYLDKFFSYPLFAVARMINREQRGPVLTRVFPSFHNWVHFPNGGATHLVNHGNRPIDTYLFGLFVENAMLFTHQNFADDAQFVFLESWNGWLEGSQIEPSVLDGDLVFNATRAAIDRSRYVIQTRLGASPGHLQADLLERIDLLCEAARNI
jgi:hypothetical protein